MSAAMEASLNGIDSIGFSLLDFDSDADFAPAQVWIEKIMRSVLEKGLQGGKLLNVNIPKLPLEEIKGMKICVQSDSRWVEEFEEKEDPMGQKYYWITGSFVSNNLSDESDVKALDDGYISIVPSMHDLTDYKTVNDLKWLER